MLGVRARPAPSMPLPLVMPAHPYPMAESLRSIDYRIVPLIMHFFVHMITRHDARETRLQRVGPACDSTPSASEGSDWLSPNEGPRLVERTRPQRSANGSPTEMQEHKTLATGGGTPYGESTPLE